MMLGLAKGQVTYIIRGISNEQKTRFIYWGRGGYDKATCRTNQEQMGTAKG